MNYTQHKPQYDADGKDISGPTYEVQLVYEPNLRSHCADPTRIGVPSDQREPRGCPSPRRPSRPRKAQTSQSALERHARKCVICRHPDREEIEECFLHWDSPLYVAVDFKVPPRAIYRHAHATGLYQARQGNLRSVLDRVLERSGEASLTGESIIRAVRAYSCLTSENQWVEPPSRVIFSSQPLSPASRTEDSAPAGHGEGLPAVVTVSPRLPARQSCGGPARQSCGGPARRGGPVGSGDEIVLENQQELIDTSAIRK